MILYSISVWLFSLVFSLVHLADHERQSSHRLGECCRLARAGALLSLVLHLITHHISTSTPPTPSRLLLCCLLDCQTRLLDCRLLLTLTIMTATPKSGPVLNVRTAFYLSSAAFMVPVLSCESKPAINSAIAGADGDVTPLSCSAPLSDNLYADFIRAHKSRLQLAALLPVR